MRRLLLLLALVVLLAGVILLNNAAANWHYVVSAAPGALLYAASFDGGAADGFNAEWEQYDGRLAAQIVGGALRLSDRGDFSNNPFSVTSHYFSDFDVRIHARYTVGPLGGTLEDGFGLIFRLEDMGNDVPEDNEYYLFQISNDGFYRVAVHKNGETRDLSTWIDSPVINQGVGGDNTLRVVTKGNAFAFYINDQRMLLCIPDDPDARSTYSFQGCVEGTMRDTLVDDSISSGKLGLVLATTVDAPEVAVEFDQVVVYAPEGDGGG